MTPQTDLVTRVRTLLPAGCAVREVSMFGGLSVMVDEKMIVSARKDGGLLVRVDDARHEEFLRLPGARQAIMGADRDMGPGWIEVEPDAVADEAGLSSWVALAMAFNRRSANRMDRHNDAARD